MFFIVGPTAVGKTDIAAEVAARTDAEIISADAFQIYSELEILTAKPNRETLAKARHHLIGEIPLMQSFDVAQFLEMAKSRAAEIRARDKNVIVAGGTGLYVRALTHGLADLPQANLELRAELEATSLAQLQMRYRELDPAGAERIDLQNKRRLVRAIEVCLLTQKPFSSFRGEWEKSVNFSSGILLTRDREDLWERINQRVQLMFKQGLFEEVQSLSALGPTAAQALGLREAQLCLRSEISQDEAMQKIAQATRQYAKRQLTWFRRDSIFEPLNLTTLSPETAIDLIARKARTFFAA